MLTAQEREALERVIVWGEPPTVDSAVERLELELERELAATPESEGE